MKRIHYENGGIRFTILERGGFYHLDFYRPDGKRVRKSTKRKISKDNLFWIKNVLIPDIILALGQEPTKESKKEWTLDEWAREHFDSQIGKNKPQTIKRKRQHYQLHIYPYLGERLINTIDLIDLEKWQKNLINQKDKSDKPYKIQTIHTYRGIFYGILEHAKRAEIIDKNYFDNIPSPKTYKNLCLDYSPTEIIPFTNQEMELIFSNAQGYLKNYIKLMRYTGARPAELIALNWDDIDWSRRVISITKTRSRDIETSPKTESSIREIDMLQKAKEALEAQYELTKNDPKIFMSAFHKPFYSHDIIALQFKKLLIKLNIPPRPLYNLRHTFASQAISRGVNILWVSRMLGHKDVSITLQVYTKYIKEDDVIRLKNIEKLDQIL